MNKEQLTSMLKGIGLSKKDFAELANISYNTVNNWNDDNKPIPSWVESWLDLYIDNKECKELKQLLQETVCQK
ncbi:helix-turn-helix transcriptional regulator [Sulfurovum sp. NBC37-1]|uniref:helix-turn-helix transcriptional regulator n=1 Tax=Sulfurovum sp. (strain NBC37-1) TaxID=387093 RepID=UPI0001587B0A|nr:helix-turn-helix transcriptional regulator [Sulfurovum sp. NBC37-1]BAF73354.1 conserved hypothetical protein [Sulfurovum sp. NBC37-1]